MHIILLAIWLLISKKIIDFLESIFRNEVGGLLGFFIVFILPLIIIAVLLDYSAKRDRRKSKEEKQDLERKLKDPNVSNIEKEEIKEYFKYRKIELEREENLEASLKDVFYLGGHHEVAYSQKVDIYIYENKLDFYPKNNLNLLFTINDIQIENVRYETISEHTKDLIIGPLATAPLEDLTQIIIIEYISEYGVKNELSVSTGGMQDRDFYGLVNVMRNKGYKKRMSKEN